MCAHVNYDIQDVEGPLWIMLEGKDHEEGEYELQVSYT